MAYSQISSCYIFTSAEPSTSGIKGSLYSAKFLPELSLYLSHFKHQDDGDNWRFLLNDLIYWCPPHDLLFIVVPAAKPDSDLLLILIIHWMSWLKMMCVDNCMYCCSNTASQCVHASQHPFELATFCSYRILMGLKTLQHRPLHCMLNYVAEGNCAIDLPQVLPGHGLFAQRQSLQYRQFGLSTSQTDLCHVGRCCNHQGLILFVQHCFPHTPGLRGMAGHQTSAGHAGGTAMH